MLHAPKARPRSRPVTPLLPFLALLALQVVWPQGADARWTGRFGRPWRLAGETYFVGAPCLVDLDCDGRPELALAGDEDAVYLVERREGWRLPRARRIRVGGDAWSPSAADIDGDGAPSLLVPLEGDASELVLLEAWGQRGYRIQARLRVAEARMPSPSAGDFDGDGDLDLAVATSDGLRLIWNQNGSFVTGPWLADCDPAPRVAPAVGDFDGDGLLDLACGGSELVVSWNLGGGSFETIEDPILSSPDYVTAARLGDGAASGLFAADFWDVVRLSFGPGRRARVVDRVALPGSASVLQVLDADGDGIDDALLDASTLIACGPNGSVAAGEPGRFLALSDGPSGNLALHSLAVGPAANHSARLLDFDLDGVLDYVERDADGYLQITPGLPREFEEAATAPDAMIDQVLLGPYTFQPCRVEEPREPVLLVEREDRSPLVAVGGAEDPLGRIALLETDLQADSRVGLMAVGPRPRRLAAGHFWGRQERPGLAIALDGPDPAILLLRKVAPRKLEVVWRTRCDSLVQALCAADVDGDGCEDLVVASETLGIIWGNLTGAFERPVELAAGLDPGPFAVGDLDEDQLPEIVASTGAGTSILWNEGGRAFTRGEAPYGGAQAAIVDLDRDARSELLFLDPGLSIYRAGIDRSFELRETRQLPPGGSSDLAVGDLDGDERPEIVFASHAFCAIGPGFSVTGGLEGLFAIRGGEDGSTGILLDLGAPPFPCRDWRLTDVDDDGDLDLLGVAIYEPFVVWRENLAR